MHMPMTICSHHFAHPNCYYKPNNSHMIGILFPPQTAIANILLLLQILLSILKLRLLNSRMFHLKRAFKIKVNKAVNFIQNLDMVSFAENLEVISVRA